VSARLVGGAAVLALILAFPMGSKDVPPFEATCTSGGEAAEVTPDTRAVREAADAQCAELHRFADEQAHAWLGKIVDRVTGLAR
jgi:hypothetical protein